MEDKEEFIQIKGEHVLGRGSIIRQGSGLRKSVEHGRFVKVKQVLKEHRKEHRWECEWNGGGGRIRWASYTSTSLNLMGRGQPLNNLCLRKMAQAVVVCWMEMLGGEGTPWKLGVYVELCRLEKISVASA